MLIFFYLPTIPFIPKPANKFLPLRIIPIFVGPHPSTAPRSLPTRLENRYNASGQVPKGIFHIRLSDFHHQHVNKSPTEQSTQTDRQTDRRIGRCCACGTAAGWWRRSINSSNSSISFIYPEAYHSNTLIMIVPASCRLRLEGWVESGLVSTTHKLFGRPRHKHYRPTNDGR